MNIKVRYQSRSGNTKKVAEAIAQEVDVTACAVSSDRITEDTDILFLGGAVYAGKIDDALKIFVEGLDSHVKRVAVFSTSFRGQSAYPEVKKILEPKGIVVSEQTFLCKGKFFVFVRKHPDREDLQAAKKFAKEIISRYGV